jgi:hypothetical protein
MDELDHQASYRRLVILASSREAAGLLRKVMGTIHSLTRLLFPCGVNEEVRTCQFSRPSLLYDVNM